MVDEHTESSLRAAAAYFRAGLRTGVVPQEEAVRWADRAIERLEHPPVALLDVSLARPGAVNDVLAALSALLGGPGADEPPESARALLDRLRADLASGRRTLDATVACLYRVSYAVALPEDLRWEIVALEDDYSLAVERIVGDVGAMEAQVRAWLARFDGAAADVLGPDA